ncbi:MAG: ABC transporter ATP-binding protein [Burkholderiales bacterium]|jgi:putative ABC transport system ATP-binding protein
MPEAPTAKSPAPILELKQVGKRFTADRSLLRGIDLQIAQGERVALLGASGTGKSTLLNLACGLEPVDEGRVILCGECLANLDDGRLSALRARSVGFVFQAFHLVSYLRLWQNVALALVINQVSPSQARIQACEMLARVGLAGREDAFAHELSGGEQQRVALARALVHRPQLILADEPTGNLDPQTAAQALQLLDEQVRAHGAALLMVTHSEQAAALADRCVRLDAEGQLR